MAKYIVKKDFVIDGVLVSTGEFNGAVIVRLADGKEKEKQLEKKQLEALVNRGFLADNQAEEKAAKAEAARKAEIAKARKAEEKAEEAGKAEPAKASKGNEKGQV